MKKLTMVLLLINIMTMTAFAGSIPEDLLGDENAELYFAEVVSYDAEKDTAELKAVKVIKGDVTEGETAEYNEIAAVGMTPGIGGTYLVAYFDEINPTYLFETTSTDTSKLKLKHINGARMWKRIEEYLNNGEYEAAEQDRIDRINAYHSRPEEVTLAVYLGVERDNVERVIFNNSEEQTEVDKDKFFEIAEKTVLRKSEATMPADRNGIYIETENKDGTYSFAYISRKGEADKCSLMMSRLPETDYTVKMSAVRKLEKLLPKSSGKMHGYVGVTAATAVLVLAVAVVAIIKRKR